MLGARDCSLVEHHVTSEGQSQCVEQPLARAQRRVVVLELVVEVVRMEEMMELVLSSLVVLRRVDRCPLSSGPVS